MRNDVYSHVLPLPEFSHADTDHREQPGLLSGRRGSGALGARGWHHQLRRRVGAAQRSQDPKFTLPEVHLKAIESIFGTPVKAHHFALPNAHQHIITFINTTLFNERDRIQLPFACT